MYYHFDWHVTHRGGEHDKWLQEVEQ